MNKACHESQQRDYDRLLKRMRLGRSSSKLSIAFCVMQSIFYHAPISGRVDSVY